MAVEEAKVHFRSVRFMMEAGIKLNMKSLSLASAATIYHKFYYYASLEHYEPYLIATTALYLAGKIDEDHVRLRDVINVSYRTLHRDKPPLDLDDLYWKLRESVVQCELFVLRELKFKVTFDHPHKYLLHYMKTLFNWLDSGTVRKVPIARTAWLMLRDSYHGKICLHYKAQHLAVAVLYFSLSCYGVEVPYNHQAETKWWEALCEGISIWIIKTIISDIISIYDLETIK